MAKITLVQLPHKFEDKFLIKSFYNKVIGDVIPSFNLPILGSYVQQFGHDVEIFFPKKPEDLSKIKNTDAIGFTLMSCNYSFFMESLDFCKNGIPIIIGGSHASFDEKLMKNEKISATVIGEGEIALTKILDSIDGDKKLKRVYREKLIKNLDELPNIDWDLINAPKYFGVMSTSRGCPVGCNFCVTSKLYGCRWRCMSPERIMKEVEDKNWKSVFFLDDNFLLDTNRINKFLDLKEESGLNFDWFCFSRCDTIARNPEIIKRMRDDGCFLMFLGIESMSDAILNKLNKKSTRKINEKAVKVLKDNRISIWSATMVGPYDTEKTMKSLLDFILKINPAIHETSILTPFLGTEIYYKLKKEGRLLHEDWSLYDGEHCVYRPYYISAERLQKNTEEINIEVWKRIRYRRFYKAAFLKNELLFKIGRLLLKS